MKTAISVPDDLFKAGERLMKRLKTSRSELYAQALRDYLARHSPDEVTAAMDRACDEAGQASDALVRSAAIRTLKANEW